MREIRAFLPRQSLITIYEAFLKPHLNHEDIVCDQRPDSFHQKMKSTQYNAAVAITGGIRGTSREKLYQGLGLESSV